VLPGEHSAAVSFTAPPSDGGSPITGYVATATPVAGGPAVTAQGSSSPITIDGLTAGSTYTVTLAAINAVGTGPATSPSSGITPFGPIAVTTPATLVAGTVGRSYTTRLAATGGPGTYVWALASGSQLPTGLALRADGTLTGTPRTAGASTFSAVVTNSLALPTERATARFSLTVAPAPKPDLAVALAPTSDPVHGRTTGYRVTVTNTGNGPTTAPIVVALALGRGQAAQGATAPGWVCSAHGLLCGHAGHLAPGQRLSYVVSVTTSAAVGAKVTATVHAYPSDATPADDQATVTGTVKRN
jgi:hypothetical protein